MSDSTLQQEADQRFKYLPAIPNELGGQVSVYESSAENGPHLWLSVTNRFVHDPTEAVAHLTAKNARRLAEQLVWLCDHHIQSNGHRP